MQADDAALRLAEAAMGCLATRMACRIALCCDATLPPLLAALHTLPAFRRLDWPHLHVFATDERAEPAALQALAALPLPRGNLVRPRVAGIGRIEAARSYEQALRAHFSLPAGAVPVFDIVVLAAGSTDESGDCSAAAWRANEVGRLVVTQPRGTPVLALSASVLAAARCQLQLASPPRRAPTGPHAMGHPLGW